MLKICYLQSKTSQELRMLSLSLFIQRSQTNCLYWCSQLSVSCNQCLKCHVSGHKNCHQKLSSKMSLTIVIKKSDKGEVLQQTAKFWEQKYRFKIVEMLKDNKTNINWQILEICMSHYEQKFCVKESSATCLASDHPTAAAQRWRWITATTGSSSRSSF